jgi:hypothetical protein
MTPAPSSPVPTATQIQRLKPVKGSALPDREPGASDDEAGVPADAVLLTDDPVAPLAEPVLEEVVPDAALVDEAAGAGAELDPDVVVPVSGSTYWLSPAEVVVPP